MKLDTLQALQGQFGADAITPTENFRGEETIIVAADKIREACVFLRDTAGLEYIYLSGLSGVDYYLPTEPEPEPGRFAVCYHLLSMRYNHRLRLKVYWNEGDAAIPSVTPLWPAADWEEREVFDMFGIEFDGHPNLKRLLMPEDWQGYPQRKDAPLGYETVQFSFNFDEVNKHKPYAKE